MTSTSHSDEAPDQPQLEIVLDAVVERGMIRPRVPLSLPEGTPLQLRIAAQLTATVRAPGEAELPAAPPPPAPLPAWRPGPMISGLRERLAAIPQEIRPVLVCFGLALAILGQLEFHRGLAFSWAGLLYALAGALLFGAAFVGVEPAAAGGEAEGAPAGEARPEILRNPWRLGALLVVGLGSVGLLQALRAQPPMPSYLWTLPAWLFLIGLYGVATLEHRLPRPDWRRLRRPLALAALAIFLLALAVRAWDLAGYPATLSGDEGRFGVETMKVLRGEINNPFTTGWLSVPTLTFFYNAPTVALLGNTLEGLRMPWAIMGALNVLTLFWLVNRLQGPAVAVISAALLAVFHYHIHFSRLGLNNIADPFFTCLALLLLYRAYDRRSALDWVLCGAVIGIGQYFYFGARFIAIVTVATLLCMILRDGRRFWAEHGRGLLVGVGAALVASAPIIQYAILYPDIYNARVNQTGILQSGWLTNEVVVRSQPAWQILLDQLQRAALAYNAYPDRTVWYALPEPFFGLTAGAIFVLGLGYAAIRLLDPRLFPMVAWWGGAIVLGGMLTESPPASQRLITTAAPAVFFVALALVRGAGLLGRLVGPVRWERPLRYAALALAVAAFSISSLRLYFVDYSPKRVYGSFNGVVSTSVGYYAREQLGPDWRIYFLGMPRMSYGFGSNLYLAPEVEGVDVDMPQDGPESLRVAGTDKSAAFVVLPERANELDMLSQIYPGGQLETIPSPIDQTPLYFVYKVPLQQLGG